MSHDADTPKPRRKSLPHDIPIWIDPAEEVYFVTVNCRSRGVNTLCHDQVAMGVFDSIAFRNRSREWFCHLCLLMPDHLHALITFTNPAKTISQTLGDWKRWLAKQMGIQWQVNFFEHRLRSEQEQIEKAEYILNNPVRQGLVANREDWRFIWRA